MAEDAGAAPPVRQGPPDLNGLFSVKIDNLAYDTRAEDIRPIFEKYGEIADLFMPKDRSTGRFRGFAFVRYRQEAQAMDAVAKEQGASLHGRELRLEVARYGRGEGPVGISSQRRQGGYDDRDRGRGGYDDRRGPGGYGGGGGGGYGYGGDRGGYGGGGYNGGGGYGGGGRDDYRRDGRGGYGAGPYGGGGGAPAPYDDRRAGGYGGSGGAYPPRDDRYAAPPPRDDRYRDERRDRSRSRERR